jgi:hypothetical protein
MRSALVFVLALVGCGKGPEAPASSPPAAVSPPDQTDAGQVAATPPAVADDGGAPPAPTASAAATTPPPEPPKDDCAPVAAAYEASLRPKLRKCWLDAANKKKDVMIVGEVKYVIAIDGLGKIASMKQTETSTTLPNDVVACMTKAVKAEKLDTKKCTFKTLNVAEKFPR